MTAAGKFQATHDVSTADPRAWRVLWSNTFAFTICFAILGIPLGEIGRGDTAVAFERAVFAAPAGTLCLVLVDTEFGLHIIRVHEKSPGLMLPFDQVELRIRVTMSQAPRDLAERRYAMEAVSRANIQGWKDGVAT